MTSKRWFGFTEILVHIESNPLRHNTKSFLVQLIITINTYSNEKNRNIQNTYTKSSRLTLSYR